MKTTLPLRTILVLAISTTGLSTTHAQSVTETQASSISGSVNLLSRYYFRGIDQTWGQAAVQGNLDWSHASGWYAGTGLSNISSRSYPGGRVEVDLYGGYKGQISPDWDYSVGAFAYVYPAPNALQQRWLRLALPLPVKAMTR